MAIEYIDRAALLRIAEQQGHVTVDDIVNEDASDVVEVVRCKDCQHFKNYGKTSLLTEGKNIKAGWCHRRVRYDEEYRMPPDGFCSYGKRRDGGAGK